ncbi:Transcriptional regulator, TetR family [Pseudonocardia sp. Ae168_Ps1]|nr:Transcriptional regulator, TetR family [Pseudonocardia sp. Ae150A_Ps1]OLL78346.1 Transcriptional regulator, TetR family [Pseudonocardia sp. Ae168_Ps1]OLL87528.1 Transcriptional regulator, TetR family [Pseudonocardia sp. Ae263_Ps1]OLL92442.1 Transcriptional regulator, TetR family [Pseudonocardia sp. Ae356_Ps1]
MVQRTRDPARKQKILRAAAELLAHNGFHAVSMADIGARAGITGSAIYRHFDSKSAILVALFERIIDDLLEDGRRSVEGATDLEHALEDLIAGQVDFAVGKRVLAQVYHNEIQNLPADDQVRLRRKQRLYIEEWVHLLGELAPGRDENVVRTLAHTAIGAIQSVLFHQVLLPEAALRGLLRDAAHAILRLESPDGSGTGTRPATASAGR